MKSIDTVDLQVGRNHHRMDYLTDQSIVLFKTSYFSDLLLFHELLLIINHRVDCGGCATCIYSPTYRTKNISSGFMVINIIYSTRTANVRNRYL